MGFVSDRFGREPTAAVATIGAILAGLTLLRAKEPSQLWALYLYSTLFGLGMGLIAVNTYAALADLFSGKHLGSIAGLFMTSLGIGFAIRPWLAGHIYDATGTYSVCLWIAAPRRVRLVAGRVRGR